MGFKARVYKIFISSPCDVLEERAAIRRQIDKWNAIHSEKENIILLPISWETHSVAQAETHPQNYINEAILSNCDLLMGVFWCRVGTPTPRENSGTIDEIKTHIRRKKPAMIFFSNQEKPHNSDLYQINEIEKFKNEFRDRCYYVEYSNIIEFESVVYKQIELFVNSGKLHVYYDSDVTSMIESDSKLAKQISERFPIVAKRVLSKIIDEKHDECVWDAIIKKLEKSPADLRDALYFMTDRGAFLHPAFEKGYITLAKCSEVDYFSLLTYVYTVNSFTFKHMYTNSPLSDVALSNQIKAMIDKDEYIEHKIRETSLLD